MNTNLFTVAEIAKYLHISRSYVFRLINGGHLPVIRIGKLLRVSPADLQRFVRNHRSEAHNG